MKLMILSANGKMWQALQVVYPPQGTIGCPGFQADTKTGAKINEPIKNKMVKLKTEGKESFINYFNNACKRPSA